MNYHFSINKHVAALVFVAFTTLICNAKQIYPDGECVIYKDKTVCNVTVSSIQKGPQFLEFKVVEGMKDVVVGVEISVEKGAISAWLKDSMQKEMRVNLKKDQLSIFKGLAEVRESSLSKEPVFHLYLESFLFEKAENISILISFETLTLKKNQQDSKLTPVEQLEQLINDEISLKTRKIGVVKIISNKENEYVATQIIHPFDELKQKQQDKASLLGWKSGQAVKIWIFPDFKFKILKSDVKKECSYSLNNK